MTRPWWGWSGRIDKPRPKGGVRKIFMAPKDIIVLVGTNQPDPARGSMDMQTRSTRKCYGEHILYSHICRIDDGRISTH